MNRSPGSGRALALAAVLAGLLAPVSCVFTDEEAPHDGPTTEAGNPALTGVVRTSGGTPAPGSSVILWKLPDFPANSPAESLAFRAPVRVDSQVAGDGGKYAFGKLAPGTYAVEAADGSRAYLALLPRAEIPAGDTSYRRTDTLALRPAARLHGLARRDPRSRPSGLKGEEGILVRLGGWSRAAYTDTAGSWSLEGIPQGRYALGFAAADGHYLPRLLDTLAVPAAADIEVPKVTLEWSPFVDPPAPLGLTVTPDSAAGTVGLAWRGVSVSNFHHYEVIRRDSLDAFRDDTLRTADTVAVDTLAGVPAGHVLRYAVVTVNSLGARSPERAAVGTGTGPKPPDTPAVKAAVIARVVDGAGPRAAVRVRLHALPEGPGPADSLPRIPVTWDSAVTDAQGKAVFKGVPAGGYSLEALAPGNTRSALLGVRPRDTGAEDTLRLAAPGSLKGSATRQAFWCTNMFKGDDFITVTLIGFPGLFTANIYGVFEFPALAAGTRKVVIHAQPFGCFEPDTVTAEIRPGQATELPKVAVRPVPGFVPKLVGLRLDAGSRAAAELSWRPAPWAYPDLKGYEVVRRDAALRTLKSSGLVSDTAWKDDLSGVPSGTALNYVVRAVDKSGRTGSFGGTDKGEPVFFTVP